MLEQANRPKGLPSRWTDGNVELLKKLWSENLSATQVAREIGCGFTRNAIIGKVIRLGLPARMKPRQRIKHRADSDRRTTMRIKTIKFRGPSNGGAQIVESVVWEESPKPAEFLGVAFLDLEPGQCKFPRGEGADIRFCGQTRMSGQPYCRKCCNIAFNYVPPPKRAYLPLGNSKPRVI